MTIKTSFRLTPDAQTDLIDIRRYTLKQWGTKQSLKYTSELRQTFLALSDSPNLGKKRPEVGDKVFSFPFVSHEIYYTIANQKLVVFAVLHKRMVPVLHLENRITN